MMKLYFKTWYRMIFLCGWIVATLIVTRSIIHGIADLRMILGLLAIIMTIPIVYVGIFGTLRIDRYGISSHIYPFSKLSKTINWDNHIYTKYNNDTLIGPNVSITSIHTGETITILAKMKNADKILDACERWNVNIDAHSLEQIKLFNQHLQ